MTSTLNQDLHADHRAWLADLSLWQDDVREWRAELGRALDDLRAAEGLLRAHAQGIDEHAVELDAEEEAVRQHECGIVLVERAGGLEAGPHDDQAARHPRRREAHERLKKYHHTVLARVSLLLKAITAPA
ncbi:MAG TPA: hypothetical protein VM597_21865 [Gemmataceae bacterium]|jgi:hypothetical protein|nr:hypothetical protein [Gemmataceae bacterium]